MANKIVKGLTVEIGGDTTKLGKALEDVEKKSRDLSSELGSINKLLKLDPGNTELLAQKQKVLADAVENTGAKLQKLKEAEKQVQAQFKRGEASEEQVRALQREIIATEKKLDGYKNAAKETAKGVKELADASDQAGEASEGLGSKLGSVAKGGLAAVAGALTSVVGGLVGCAEATREYRTDMGKLDTAFTTAGHTSEAATETYKTLQGVLGESDQAVEAANHLAQLADNEEDLATWTDIATGVYATFGASLPIENLTEAANETAKTGAITGGLADALNWAGVSEEQFQAQLDACSTEQERQALITETLNGLYSETAEKYRETNAEIIRANEANEAWTASMAEAGAAVEPLLTDIKLLGASLLSDLMPGITLVASSFRNVLSGEQGAAEGLGAAVSGIITDLLNKIIELLPTVTQVAMSLLTTLTTTLIASLPQLVTTGIQMVTSILNGLTQAIPQIVTALVNMIPQLVQALVTGIPLLIQGAVDLFLALVDAIPKIIPPLVAALPQIVMAVINGLLTAIPQLIEGALQFLLAIVDALPLLIEVLVGALPQIITTIITGLLNSIPLLLDAALQLFMALVDAIPLIVEQLILAVPAILTAIVDSLRPLGSRIWTILSDVINRFVTWATNVRTTARNGFNQVVSAVISIARQLPGKIWTWLQQTINKVVTFGVNATNRARTAANNIFNAVVNGIKNLPSRMASIGTDLVKGLWNGINNMTSWVKSKIQGFTDDVLKGIKDFFGVNSPSKETEWVGDMLDRGLAKGVLDNMDAPMDAMADVADGMLGEADSLNGLTLERQLNHTFAGETAAPQTGLLTRLDNILAAIERGQILTIDGDKLVGATADRLDSKLGQRRALVARGAI